MSPRDRAIRILTLFYLIPLAGMIFFNTANSLLRSTYFDLYSDMETAKYRWDVPWATLLWTAAALALIFLLSERVLRPLSVKKLSVITMSLGGLLSLGFVLLFRCTTFADGEALSLAAQEFMHGNYDSFLPENYLFEFPFQLGMTAFLELLYRLFGAGNYLVFQLLNVLATLYLLWRLNGITELLFRDERIVRYEALLSVGMLPLFLYATFIYGDIPGLSLGIGGIYHVLRFMDTDKSREMGAACIHFLFGVLLKSNINIFVTAAAIALFLNALQKRRYRTLLWIPALLLLSQTGVWITERIYMVRAGLSEFPKGAPKLAWIAMSLQEADEGGYAPGWYNGYNWAVYGIYGYDRRAAAAACLESIRSSLGYFLRNKRYALDYFYKKFSSSWNAPDFQSLISNEWGTRHAAPLSSFADALIYGRGHDLLYEIMNVYHFLIFLCASAGILLKRKDGSLKKAYYLLNIFGGFLFHMIWETQSRYILGYFVLLLPIAAAGLSGLSGLLDLPGIAAEFGPKTGATEVSGVS